jgi:quercetin dioxygenase-like cupin family protein
MSAAIHSARLAREPRRSLLVLGQELGVLATPGDSRGSLCAFEQRLAPRQRIVWNVHRAHTEINWVVEGRLRYQVGSHSGEAGPGSAVVVPEGRWHTLQGGPQGARLILGFTPADIFSMFEELARRAGPQTAAAIGCAPHILARYRSQAHWLLTPGARDELAPPCPPAAP